MGITTGEYDVIVLGGGPTGVSAAISAAKTGARTAIVERYGYLGGQATGGLVILLVGLTNGKERIIKGFCEETINRLTELGATRDVGRHVLFDPESMKYVFDLMIEENNVTPYYHTFVSGVIKEENRVSGVITESKSGTRVFKAKMFVDATGDGDLAKYCELPFDIEQVENRLPVTLGFRVGGIDTASMSKFIRENREFYQNLLNKHGISTKMGGWVPTMHSYEAWFNISTIENIDITDANDLTKAEIIGRRQIQHIIKAFREVIPGFEQGYLIDTASQIGVRDSRRIRGMYHFTQKDVTRTSDDVIALAPDYTDSGRGFVQVPYGCLVSKESENVIFAGRCISVEHKLLDMFREIPCCMATGQAAGIAAAYAAGRTGNLHTVDIKAVHETLLSQGAKLSHLLHVKT
ncbi:MAG: hypothetical protein A2Y25_04380 [Candidatus Melainabacteria bacterium GWF2_37_15]|nr:MAG: hypothetical protein A2Y25_04380 [Candidatus Melainabacteria bacterium GWF2_37_15]